MPDCIWFADYTEYVESPLYPHNCPTGMTCEKPPWPSPPPDYGAQVRTLCA